MEVVRRSVAQLQKAREPTSSTTREELFGLLAHSHYFRCPRAKLAPFRGFASVSVGLTLKKRIRISRMEFNVPRQGLQQIGEKIQNDKTRGR